MTTISVLNSNDIKLSKSRANGDSLNDELKALVTDNKRILFMKGNRLMPQCGFSAHVVGLLSQYTDEFVTVDILQDPEIRQGMKDYSNWPTYPQLYVDGEFVGGADILKEMYQAGELQELLK